MTRNYRPAVTQWRLDLIAVTVLAAALGLIVYDAWVSLQGFTKLNIGLHAPYVFAGIIFVTQLGIGVLHATGEDFRDISGASGHGFIKDGWGWILVVIYGVDVASNALSFGVLNKLQSATVSPVDGLGGAALVCGMAGLLAFGDEILLRLYDKISAVGSKNRVYARRHRVAIEANNAYINTAKERQVQQAQVVGRKEGDFRFGDGL